MRRPRDYCTRLPNGHGLGRTGTGKWVACKGCSQSFSYTVFCGRHMDACPQLQPLRRLLEGWPMEGMAGGPTGAAAAGAAHRGSSSRPGNHVAPAPRGAGGWRPSAGAAPCDGGGGAAEAAACANFGGAPACARGATGLGAAGVPKDARSGVREVGSAFGKESLASVGGSAAARGSAARDIKPAGGAHSGFGMGQRDLSQAAGGAGVVKQERGSVPRAGAPQPEAEDCDDDEELDEELEDGSEDVPEGDRSEEDSWEERQRRRGPVWYWSGDEMEGPRPGDEAWYRAHVGTWPPCRSEDDMEEEMGPEWDDAEDEECDEEEEESDPGSEAGEAAAAELRVRLDQPLYPGARAGLTLRASCQGFLRLCERHSFSTAAADAFLRLEAEILPAGNHAPTSMRLLRNALGCAPARGREPQRSPEAMRARLARTDVQPAAVHGTLMPTR